MTNRGLALSVLLVIGLLQGCSATAQRDQSLVGAWRVERVATQVVPADGGPTLTFDKDKRAHGSGGCNRYQGSYDVAAMSLTFGPLAATRRACPTAQMDLEQLFFGTLAKVKGYQRDGSTLKLLAADDGVVIVLRQTN